MNKSTIILLSVLGVILFTGFYGCNRRNAFIGMEGTVKQKASDMQVQYQRRMDLIDQLVKTVKGQVAFEQKTLTDVVNARANATRMQINVETLDPDQLKKFQAAQGELSQALGRFLSISENYPELKSSQAFGDLRAEISGTENRIQFARNDYNQSVRDFNVAIKQIPGTFFAWGMKDYPSFEAETGAEKRPDISF